MEFNNDMCRYVGASSHLHPTNDSINKGLLIKTNALSDTRPQDLKAEFVDVGSSIMARPTRTDSCFVASPVSALRL